MHTSCMLFFMLFKLNYTTSFNIVCHEFQSHNDFNIKVKETVNPTFWLNEGKINFVQSCSIISISLFEKVSNLFLLF